MNWYTADLHLGHENIIAHCNRPFDSVEAMDAALIDNLNAALNPGDRLFILGDFLGLRRKAALIRPYLDRIRLNPQQIVFILGNHDDDKETRKVFPFVYDLYTVKDGEQRLVLCHYAMRVWNQSNRGTWHLYGHSHGNLADDPHALSLDVGVDCCDYRPVSLPMIAERMALKEWRPVDHHVGAMAEATRAAMASDDND